MPNRCEHGIDSRVGTCAECEPDAPVDYRSFAPVREPFVPDEAALRRAGRESAGVETYEGQATASVTFTFREGASPLVMVEGALSRADGLALVLAAREVGGSAYVGRSALQWFDNTIVQADVDKDWDRRELAKQQEVESRERWRQERPLVCRWCQDDNRRYKRLQDRARHERSCDTNPDNWFPETTAKKGWWPMVPTFDKTGHTRGAVSWGVASDSVKETARRMADKYRADRAHLFE